MATSKALKIHRSRVTTALRGRVSTADIPKLRLNVEISYKHSKNFLMDYIAGLPLELFLQIIEYLGSLRDLSSLTRCARHTCWRASQTLFNITFAGCCKFRRPELVFQRFAFRAISLDSQRMMQWLVYHELSSRLNELVFSFLFLFQYPSLS
jgi:hypothetical protein